MTYSLCPDAAAELWGLFDLTIAPPLLFYSYIPIFVLCMIFGTLILFHDKFSTISKYFFGIVLFFGSYILLSIIQWIAAYVEVVQLAWQLYFISELGVFLFAVLFAYVFVFEKDVPHILKSISLVVFVLVALVVPTRLNVDSFDLSSCEGIPGRIWPITYIFELSCLGGIMVIALYKMRSIQGRVKKLRTAFISGGLVFFLAIFWSSNYFGELTNTYEINLIGPLGMFIFIGVLSYMMVRFRVFNAKLFVSEILIIALCFLIAALLFIQEIYYIHIVVLFTFGLICILGGSLIKSVKREIEQREKIEKLAKDLDTANHQKDELISIVSHQLATPITSLKWNVEMLLDGDAGKLNAEQTKELTVMQSSAVNLADLVGMLLDVSRMQLGRLQVDRMDLDLGTFFSDVAGVIRQKSVEKKQTFQVEIPKGLPVARLDKRLMRMTLENLLSNAVKYTPEGGTVTFKVSVKNNVLHYEVRDTGCGIPLAEQPRMFEKLFRATNVRAIDGNGLGLFVAKGAVEAQGGRIGFESRPGRGTVFTVDLPLMQETKPSQVPVERKEQPGK